jgi:hypothetical protein
MIEGNLLFAETYQLKINANNSQWILSVVRVIITSFNNNNNNNNNKSDDYIFQRDDLDY